MAKSRLLAGDIGGTKTHLAIFEIDNDQFVNLHEKKYPSKDYKSLDAVTSLFLKEYETKIDSACFGIAGPINNGVCKTTNLPWIIETETLKKELQIKTLSLINDLEANAHGIFALKEEDFFILNEGTPNIQGNCALISAGTGLGEAGIYWDGKTFSPFACEGGHSDFAPRNELEIKLLQFLKKEESHVSYERLLSGMGLYNIYRFLLSYYGTSTSIDIGGEDPALIISKHALEETDKMCVQSLELFMEIYGAEAGNVALKFFALSGIYIGGGIAPKILEKLKTSRFMNTFCDKGRMERVLKPIPVKVILNDNAALLGAARYANLQLSS